MEAGPNDRHDRAGEPTETTALLGPSTSTVVTNHDDITAQPEDAPRPAVKMLQRSIIRVAWMSLVLAITLVAFGIAVIVLINVCPATFYPGWGIHNSLPILTSYAILLLVVNIWTLWKRSSRPFGAWAVLISLIIDGLAAAYCLSAAGFIASRTPEQSSCGRWNTHGYDDVNCHPFQEAFDATVSTWAIIGVVFALTHLVLFVLRAVHLFQTHRATQYITYDGNTATETLTSLGLTLGPFSFDFRFTLRHPPKELPAGVAPEQPVRTEVVCE